jgi:hypothetical protein
MGRGGAHRRSLRRAGGVDDGSEDLAAGLHAKRPGYITYSKRGPEHTTNGSLRRRRCGACPGPGQGQGHGQGHGQGPVHVVSVGSERSPASRAAHTTARGGWDESRHGWPPSPRRRRCRGGRPKDPPAACQAKRGCSSSMQAGERHAGLDPCLAWGKSADANTDALDGGRVGAQRQETEASEGPPAVERNSSMPSSAPHAPLGFRYARLTPPRYRGGGRSSQLSDEAAPMEDGTAERGPSGTCKRGDILLVRGRVFAEGLGLGMGLRTWDGTGLGVRSALRLHPRAPLRPPLQPGAFLPAFHAASILFPLPCRRAPRVSSGQL